MKPAPAHTHSPDVSFDGGDLDCGNGLLLLIRRHIDPMARGQILEQDAADRSRDTLIATAAADRARHLVAETREREATQRDERRLAEEILTQLTARRQALERRDP